MNNPNNESETRAELIDPILDSLGWNNAPARIRREYPISQGRLIGSKKRQRPRSADYVLVYKGQKLAVIEAKDYSKHPTEGKAQAVSYAERLNLRFAFCTNGKEIFQIDRETGQEQYRDTYPTPEELWDMVYSSQNEWRDIFGETPFYSSEGRSPRAYQEAAADSVLGAIAEDKKRILLTLATGTGKTFIAFQIAWRLFQSRYTLNKDKARQPRILFLADRNILADQAYNNFSAFGEDARCRISPAEMRKEKKVPKNANIFFTIFQSFMTENEEEPCFHHYSPDFFDVIIIDECHRGGANDESSWRDILEYFEPAVQIGLTATPKRTQNADSYKYFGDPVYTYALKDGIDDGYLTPFKVKQYGTTIDDYTYTSDDDVIEGEIEAGKVYEEKDFNRLIIMPDREEYRVKLFIQNMKPYEKAIVFCATQDHALMVRDLINKHKPSKDINYAARVVANDGKEGEKFLEYFQDDEKSIPAILTTSRKLSTGVDAPEVRHVILMRPVNSMIEFKQIVGRGTRLAKDKDFFTIHDFVAAYKHFSDPEWDGEPEEQPEKVEMELKAEKEEAKTVAEENIDDADASEAEEKTKRQAAIIKLADGKIRRLQNMQNTLFYSADGKPISAKEYLSLLYDDLPDMCRDEDKLQEIWGNPETRRTLLTELENKGYSGQNLAELKKAIGAEQSDIYDVLTFIAHNKEPIMRSDRVQNNKDHIDADLSPDMQEFIDFVLSNYVEKGLDALDDKNLGTILKAKYYTVNDAKEKLGEISVIRRAFIGFQKFLYGDSSAEKHLD